MTMSGEGIQESVEPDGMRWLRLLGYEGLADQPTGYEIDGEPVLVRDFDRLCGEHVRPIFTALEGLDPEDARRTRGIETARQFLGRFVNVEDN